MERRESVLSELNSELYLHLAEINKKPKPFEFYTAEERWADEHTSRKMLEFHLNDELDPSSRNSQFIDR